MNKNRGLTILLKNDELVGLDLINELDDAELRFFKWILPRCDGNVFDVERRKDKALVSFSFTDPYEEDGVLKKDYINETTYYELVQRLCNKKMLICTRGYEHKINPSLFKMFTSADNTVLEINEKLRAI